VRRIHVHIPYQRVREHLELLRRESLNIEIYFPSSTLDNIDREDILSLKKDLDYKPTISIHGPFMDLSPGAVDSKVREVTIMRFSSILDIAEILNPESIVFHSGYEKWKYAHKIGVWLEGCMQTWPELIERAETIGVRIAIENIFEDEPSNLVLLMKELRSGSFGICFDTGHCNLFSKVPLEEWLDALRPFIFELHLHDNDGTFDSHLPIGDGTFDFSLLFRKLGDLDCLYTIEAHTPERVIKSLERLNAIANLSGS
jgi:sugar phosphate isomerase/epimerase